MRPRQLAGVLGRFQEADRALDLAKRRARLPLHQGKPGQRPVEANARVGIGRLLRSPEGLAHDGFRPLEQGRGPAQDVDRLGQAVQAAGSPGREACHAQRDPERAAPAEGAGVGEFSLGQGAGLVAVPEQQPGLGRAGAGVQVADVSDLDAPHVGTEHGQARLEAGQRLLAVAAGQAEPA